MRCWHHNLGILHIGNSSTLLFILNESRKEKKYRSSSSDEVVPRHGYLSMSRTRSVIREIPGSTILPGILLFYTFLYILLGWRGPWAVLPIGWLPPSHVIHAMLSPAFYTVINHCLHPLPTLGRGCLRFTYFNLQVINLERRYLDECAT